MLGRDFARDEDSTYGNEGDNNDSNYGNEADAN